MILCRYILYYYIQFSVLWKDHKDETKCSCGSWNLTEVMLVSLETEISLHTEAVLSGKLQLQVIVIISV